ncbi:MAG: hypothetical protein RLZZ189_1794 [Pseudomonadota bacterium]
MSNTPIPIAVIGAGPAGLMAAEVLSAAGISVHVFDAMPSVGRKFLLAGIGGLNLTHAEPFDVFTTRFGERATACANWLQGFDAQAIREWAKGLGIDTFVGSSQRVFPTDMKAAPLLRAWLHRLRHPQQGEPVRFHMRHRWNGNITRTDTSNTPTWQLEFDTPHGVQSFHAHAVLMALGGGSWAHLGSDGAWQSWLRALQIEVAPLVPANCGFDISVGSRTGWSEHLRTKFAGTPLKSVVLSSTDAQGHRFSRKGEMVITEHGIEGSLVYAASALLRNEIARSGSAHLHLNLRPDFSAEHVLAEVRHPRGSRSLSSHLKSRLNLQAVHLALLHEVLSKDALSDPVQLAQAIQHLPITLVATRPLDEAISSAGGVKLEVLDDSLMSRHTPGLFAAGEMLDWEAPTGGYLLSACLASGRHAANGALAYLHLNSRATTSL